MEGRLGSRLAKDDATKNEKAKTTDRHFFLSFEFLFIIFFYLQSFLH